MTHRTNSPGSARQRFAGTAGVALGVVANPSSTGHYDEGPETDANGDQRTSVPVDPQRSSVPPCGDKLIDNGSARVDPEDTDEADDPEDDGDHHRPAAHPVMPRRRRRYVGGHVRTDVADAISDEDWLKIGAWLDAEAKTLATAWDAYDASLDGPKPDPRDPEGDRELQPA